MHSIIVSKCLGMVNRIFGNCQIVKPATILHNCPNIYYTETRLHLKMKAMLSGHFIFGASPSWQYYCCTYH